jgi:hypothetical protein
MVSFSFDARRAWTAGQGVSPYEQNTQQSPNLAVSAAPQVRHWYRHRHERRSIVSTAGVRHFGHVIVVVRIGFTGSAILGTPSRPSR